MVIHGEKRRCLRRRRTCAGARGWRAHLSREQNGLLSVRRSGSAWSTTFTIDVTGVGISLTDVDLEFTNFNNSGAKQGVNRSVAWTVTVDGSISSPISKQAISASVKDGSVAIVFDSPIAMTGAESYDIRILAQEGIPNSGNNTGIDAMTFHGVIPEPATLALLGLGGLAILKRRRHA